ncbi:MAG: ComEC family competence protein [Chloroflexota bacterium]|nr:ComEC family competence protein [Chloroflexota bacterium]
MALPTVLVIMLAVTLVRGQVRIPPLAIVVAAAVIGMLRGSDDVPGALPDALGASSGGAGSVASLPSPSRSGDRVLFQVETIHVGGSRPIASDFVAMLWLPEDVEVAPGDRLSVTWSIEDASDIAPGFGSYVRSQGADAVGYVSLIDDIESGGSWTARLVDLRRTLSVRFELVLRGDPGALASGIVTGDDSALSDSTSDAFLRTGTSHITAVSGSNVSMLLALWNLMVRPGRFRRMVGVQVAIITTIWLYAVLVGLEPPAVRAALVASLGLLASRSGRHPDPMTLLFLASAALVMWDPHTTRMISFWLSFVASAALIGRLPADPGRGWAANVRAIGGGVLFAYLATLPIVLAVFGTWSVSAVVANAVLAPLMMVAFPFSFMLGFVLLVAPQVAGVIAWIPGIVLEAALLMVGGLSGAASPLEFRTTGWVAIFPLGILCAIIILGFSQDGKRWMMLLVHRWETSRATVAVVSLAFLAGAAAGVALAVVR